eukprot:tig00000403_g276.t1
MSRIQGTTALITGGGSGIGRAIAHAFAERGTNVMLVGRGIQGLEGCARECQEKYGIKVHLADCDLTRVEELQRAIRECVEVFGGIDFLINNAGVLDGCKSAHEANLAEWEYCLDVNCRAPMQRVSSPAPPSF